MSIAESAINIMTSMTVQAIADFANGDRADFVNSVRVYVTYFTKTIDELSWDSAETKIIQSIKEMLVESFAEGPYLTYLTSDQILAAARRLFRVKNEKHAFIIWIEEILSSTQREITKLTNGRFSEISELVACTQSVSADEDDLEANDIPY